MPVLAVGLNHKGAPLGLLERFAFDQTELPKALLAARSSEHVHEAVILSTCNRVEVYASVDGFHAGLAALRGFLAAYHHIAEDEFADRAFGLYEQEAVSHLFSVASGIESMVIGEPQILTQVRGAFRAADAEGAVGPILSALFRHAIRVGRRVRAETGIAVGAAGLADAGVVLARAALGSLSGRTVLIVGAGKMSDLAAAHIAEAGAAVIVANRTPQRAEALAARIGGETVAVPELAAAIARADLVLASTGSPEPLVSYEHVDSAMAARGGRPLFLLDLAVPRDIDPAAGTIPGVTLRDLDDLREVVQPGREQLAEVERVRSIVAEEMPGFLAWKRAHALAPLIAALKSRGEAVRASELERAQHVLAGLTSEQADAVEALTRAIVAKLLHGPVASLKEQAGTAEGEMLARALRAIWSLSNEED